MKDSRPVQSQIPIVDFSRLAVDGPGRRQFVEDVGKAASQVGFFFIKNHGISEALLDRFNEQMRMLFASPLENKLRAHIAKSPHHRGYFPVGEENALGSRLKDVKEGFDMALELDSDDPDVVAGKPFHGPNVWPDWLPEFRATMNEYYRAVRSISEAMSRVFAETLGLPRDFFEDKMNKPLAQLRLIHYPSQDAYDLTGAIGCGTHTDYGILTLLWQDEVVALEIFTRRGEWLRLKPIPGTFVCNIGDAMERWSNGHWTATPHRVVNVSGKERFSAAFFFDPNYDCEIAPLPQFVEADTAPKFAPATMGEILGRGFDSTFTYRSSPANASSAT